MHNSLFYHELYKYILVLALLSSIWLIILYLPNTMVHSLGGRENVVLSVMSLNICKYYYNTKLCFRLSHGVSVSLMTFRRSYRRTPRYKMNSTPCCIVLWEYQTFHRTRIIAIFVKKCQQYSHTNLTFTKET